MNIKTKIANIKLNNPTILASGILGVTGASLANIANNGAGAVTSKSISLKQRKGHNCPVLVEWEHGFINAVGLSNQGIEESLEELKFAIKKTKKPVIASIFASSFDEFGLVAEKISIAKPDLIEANISCPNVENEFGKPFASNKEDAGKVTEIIKNNTNIPLIIKLSPNVPDIKPIAKAVEQAGADAINAINTLGPGMLIDIYTKKPILSNKVGGLSGPAIKPIAVKCVYDIYETINIPIIGTGGITYGNDLVEMLMAGASAVGIGTAVHYRGLDVFKKLCNELEEFMKKENYANLKQIIGKAH